MKFLGISAGVILILIVGFYFYKDSMIGNNIQSNSPTVIVKTSPSPSPFLFQEMTIPYLRSREYSSNLGELAPFGNNGNFNSYLTSYNSDGLKINALLTKPTGEMPEGGWPAIVFVHGYIPPTTYRTTEKYTDYVNFLARNGFVVFKIDLRGHGDSEGEAGGGYYSEGYVIDTLNAYEALKTFQDPETSSGRFVVNPNRIGLWGHSMAGNIVLRSLAAKPDIPVAVIWGGAGYTYVDLVEYRLNDGSYRPTTTNAERQRKRQLLRETYGEPSGGNPFWNLVAPANYLNDLKGAIQLNHAVDDDVVSIEYSRNLNNLLSQTSVPHEFNEYSSGGHNITNPSFTPAMQNTVNFFKKYLTP